MVLSVTREIHIETQERNVYIVLYINLAGSAGFSVFNIVIYKFLYINSACGSRFLSLIYG